MFERCRTLLQPNPKRIKAADLAALNKVLMQLRCEKCYCSGALAIEQAPISPPAPQPRGRGHFINAIVALVCGISSAVTKFLDIRDLGETAPRRIAVLIKKTETPTPASVSPDCSGGWCGRSRRILPSGCLKSQVVRTQSSLDGNTNGQYKSSKAGLNFSSKNSGFASRRRRPLDRTNSKIRRMSLGFFLHFPHRMGR
jgi:hypothetical protein